MTEERAFTTLGDAFQIVIEPIREQSHEAELQGRVLDPALANTARLGLQTDVGAGRQPPSVSERPVQHRSPGLDSARQR